ncbi:hypothetical protein LTR41_010638 [Exophiala xenobiotica]|nr:hypothetical protein LTR41_010638 [Exophiala xenobiotica]
MTRLLRWSDDIDMGHKRTSSASAGPTTSVSSSTSIPGLTPNLRPQGVGVSARSIAGKMEGRSVKVPFPTPEMDNVIFEDPSKQPPRLKRPSQVQTINIPLMRDDPTQGKQQRWVPSQRLDASHLDLDGFGRSAGTSTTHVNDDQDGQVHDTPDPPAFIPAGVTATSVDELFSVLRGHRNSVDEGSSGGRDSLFSSPEPEGSTMNSNRSVASAVNKGGEAGKPRHLDNYNRTGPGVDQDVAIVSQDDILHGKTANWVALQNERRDSPVGVLASRIRQSLADREESEGEEPCKESENSKRDDIGRPPEAARNDRRYSGRSRVDRRSSGMSLSDYNYTTDAVRVVDGIQPSMLDDSRGNPRQIASSTFPSPRKRQVAAGPESSSSGLVISDDQSSGRKKVSQSRSFQSRHATPKGLALAAIGSHSKSLLEGQGSRSMFFGLPHDLEEGQHDAEEGVVWEYRRLLDYRIVDGRPLVLVPWIPTWEPIDEYPEEEVDRVRREYHARIHGRRRGRPRTKQHL